MLFWLKVNDIKPPQNNDENAKVALNQCEWINFNNLFLEKFCIFDYFMMKKHAVF